MESQNRPLSDLKGSRPRNDLISSSIWLLLELLDNILRAKFLFQMAGCHDPDPQGISHAFLDIPGLLTQSRNYQLDPFAVSPSNLAPTGPGWILVTSIPLPHPLRMPAPPGGWTFLRLQLSVIRTEAYQLLPTGGLSQDSTRQVFDTGHGALACLLLKHLFNQLETTNWKG